MSEKITNSFEGGMKKDLDKKLRANNTYSLGVNGRLIYNENGSLSWENMRGNIIGINGYPEGINNRVLGKAEFPDLVVLFSIIDTGNGNFVSEIGSIIFNPDGEGLYLKLYNDNDDANGLLLKFSDEHQIEAVPFLESDKLHRVYFTDDHNQPRVFTFEKVTPTYYQAVTNSAFTFDILPDFAMGNINFNGTISGGLLTGQYQYAYRLITNDGYASPWTPPTYHIFVNNEDVSENMQAYDMGDTDEVSNKGLRLLIEGIDTRYSEIQIAYVHSIVSAGAKEAGIFVDTEITGSSMTFEHITTRGVEPIEIDELSDVKDFILKAKTIAIKDNRLWFGNIEGRTINDIPDAAFENFYAEPEYRAIMSDVRADKNITGNHGTASGGFAATSAPPQTLTFRKRKYERFDVADKYKISTHTIGTNGAFEDYTNYKGRQVSHSFTGYFRGEKYRFAGVFFDKKGFPLFAKHLADVTFPDAFGTSAADAELKAERVRTDGTIQTKTVSVGRMGGAITSGRIGRDLMNSVSPDWAFGNNQKLDDQDEASGYSNAIINQYHLAHNAPIKYDPMGSSWRPAGYYYQKTTTLWSDLNDLEAGTNNTSDNYEFQSMPRVQGVRFGGIDLDVDLGGGVKLKDVIGGFMIVRAERTDLDETIKDTGILLNCSVNGQNGDFMRPKSNPFMGAAESTSNGWLKEGQGLRTLDKTGTAGADAYSKHHAFTFDGVNHKIESVTPNIKAGSTQIKYMYDALTSVFPVSGASDNGLEGIKAEDPKLYHHWVAKFEDTVNSRKLNNDTRTPADGLPSWFKRWSRYGSKTVIRAFKDITMGSGTTSGIGTVGVEYTTRTYMASINAALKSALNMFSNYDASSGTSEDSKLALSGVADRHLLLDLQNSYEVGLGNLTNNSNSTWNTLQHLAVPVVALYEENTAQYGGTTELGIQTTIFHSTGHFQRIDDDVLNEIDNGGNHVLNEVEVWGGDCFLDFFEYLRIYPQIEFNPECVPEAKGKSSVNVGKEYRDYSCAIIYPVESKYNFKLRVSDANNGRPIWADVGTTNGATIANDTNKSYMNFQQSLDGLYASNQPACPTVEENFDVNDVLLYFDKVRSFQAKPVSYVDNVDYPTRWSWSNEKQPFNARIDKFRQFEELSNHDLDGAYGEVVGNAMLFDSIYSMQEKGFGRLQVFDRALVATEAAGDLTLGEGGVMDGIDYISKTYGSQHQWSIKASDKNIYWADARMRKLIRFGQDGLKLLSDEMGIHSYVAPYLETAVGKDNPATVGGIITAYDYDNNDVIFTFRLTNNNIYSGNPWYISGEGDLQVESIGVDWEADAGGSEPVARVIGGLPSFFGLNANQSLIFNEPVNTFTGIGTFYPTIYFNYGKHLYSNNNNKSGGLYIYGKGNRGQFMNVYYYSALQYVVNKYPNAIKRFDVSIMNINEDALPLMERVLMETENNFHAISNLSTEIVNIFGYGGVPATGNIRRAKWRQGLLKFPTRERGKRDRLTGKEAEFIVYFKNELNKKVSLTSIDTIARLHNKI